MAKNTVMAVIVTVALHSSALTVLVPTAALAQGFDETCLRIVKELCGDASAGACFQEDAKWDGVPEACMGDVQTMIEMEREAMEQQGAAAATDLPAYSYGGILRSGPGMQFKKKASLKEGQPIEILEDSGVWFDGYKWFKVKTSAGTGYHWGGIFCSEGGKPEGVFSACADYPPNGRP